MDLKVKKTKKKAFGEKVYEPINSAVLKLGVATLLRVARYFFRVAKISQDLSY
jgi:hypothetical protein